MQTESIETCGKTIILVPTAHVSKRSMQIVKETIEREKPDVVGVELDAQRLHQLLQGKQWQEMDLNRIIKEGKTHLFLINMLLANFQRRIGDDLGVKPGSEMLAAVETAAENKIPVLLLDRDVRVTLKRAFDKMSIVEKAKLGYSLLSGFFYKGEKLDEKTIEHLKEKDTLNALMQQLGKELPSIKSVLVDERDAFIADKITRADGKKIVAVIGAGHIEGVKKLVGQPLDTRELTHVSKKKSVLRHLSWLVPVAFTLLLAYGLFAKGTTTALDVFIAWFAVHAVLSALGAALARAHPLSIATAFFAAPFTALHPTLAAGWFAGLVELRIRPPKVIDFERLPEAASIGEFARNRVSRILMVTAFSNVGSAAATIIALPYMAALVA
ncbi:MAG: TraB/GumN family protein [Candidatus Diapherotrites archaeon]|nr:TraB/GumN family protein [Candidatus Diapherotrites archaeon]